MSFHGNADERSAGTSGSGVLERGGERERGGGYEMESSGVRSVWRDLRSRALSYFRCERGGSNSLGAGASRCVCRSVVERCMSTQGAGLPPPLPNPLHSATTTTKGGGLGGVISHKFCPSVRPTRHIVGARLGERRSVEKMPACAVTDVQLHPPSPHPPPPRYCLQSPALI